MFSPSTDSKGRSRTRTKSGWKTVASHEERQPFQLVDSTGSLRVIPHRAEISADEVFDEHCSRHDPLYYGKGPSGSISNSDHRRHFVEHAIPLDARIYVLIPRLVACVQGYTAHERDAHRHLAALRVEGARGRGVAARSDLAARQGQALTQVFALAEAYPDLDADENFAQLQRELVNTEDKIALAREFFNASVKALNTRIETLPDVLLAKLGRIKKGAFFAAKGFERSPVRLSFDE